MRGLDQTPQSPLPKRPRPNTTESSTKEASTKHQRVLYQRVLYQTPKSPLANTKESSDQTPAILKAVSREQWSVVGFNYLTNCWAANWKKPSASRGSWTERTSNPTDQLRALHAPRSSSPWWKANNDPPPPLKFFKTSQHQISQDEDRVLRPSHRLFHHVTLP